ncbi:MAG: TRAP transporter small permease [Clostridia bacterium]|nr:TRAP transporter small permease [Clostridia bacterium]
MPKIFHALDKVKPVYDIAEKIMMFICKLLLIADILVTCYMVIGRYVSFIPAPVWGEQVVLTLMVYMAVLSATLAIRNNAHIRMTCFDPFLPQIVVRVLDIISDILVMVLGFVMLKHGWTAAIKLGSRGFYDSLPWLSRFWMYLPVPVAGVGMIIFEIEQLYQHIKVFFIKEEKEVAA